MNRKNIELMACKLVGRVSQGCGPNFHGFWTMSIYDTAWVSMVLKPDGSWLLPESFQFILDEEQASGGWKSYASDIDGIMNTLAATLAIKKHLDHGPHMEEAEAASLQHRVVQAVAHLENQLIAWDVEACVHVGFEILVPSLLSMLEEYGISLQFPGREALSALNKQKLKNFNPNILYGPKQATALHSLEAFVGKIDFTKVAHHKVSGSMLGSPSATAAYLSGIPDWDVEAENYLRDTIRLGGGKGKGGVPSAYPCGVFELTWVYSTLVTAGFSAASLGSENVALTVLFIEDLFKSQQGIIGFAPLMLGDADDTAKAVLTLNLLGRPTSAGKMLSYFSTKDGYLMTYLGERTQSFSANCNALEAALYAPDVQGTMYQISAITTFLCNSWWNGTVADKWARISQPLYPEYSTMLLAQSLVRLLHLWDVGVLSALPDDLVRHRVPIVLSQILNRTLLHIKKSQNLRGELCPEKVAYEILTLESLYSLPWLECVLPELDSALLIHRKALLLSKPSREKPPYVWIEKVTYGSETLSEAYYLAALYALPEHTAWTKKTKSIVPIEEKLVNQYSQFFLSVHGAARAHWEYQCSVLEASFFIPKLRSKRAEVFPLRRKFHDEYLHYIPATWVIVNNIRNLNLPTTLLWDMMVFSMWDFLADEYMESKVALLDTTELAAIKNFIDKTLVEGEDSHDLGEEMLCSEGGSSGLSQEDMGRATSNIEYDCICSTIAAYIRAVLGYPGICSASIYDQMQLRQELHAFLIAHITQIKDNSRISALSKVNGGTTFAEFRSSAPRLPFYTWTHTTGAEHISCPLSWVFYTCILRPRAYVRERKDRFQSVQQKYKSRDLCSHLAVMSRLYNDFGSIERDRREMNLNSIDFPDFHIENSLWNNSGHMGELGLTRLKADLLDLAQYERTCAKAAMLQLIEDLNAGMTGGGRKELETICRGIELFVGVTELYADMYVAKDLTNAAR
ncbi:Ent-kaurene synthase [Glonium stellatum]|uniref:Ent-kaurene synthase n=1 Tax=Glonium stellatum TaxID=574774 RepID=A0A8E2JU61_9PEZI|nr:Ent-kaurene synthase [Glonium stellatum]